MRLQRRRRAVGLLFLAALPLAQRAAAHPGLADSVPSGRRVPCPPGWASCVDGVCPGVGHASCAGATLPLNAFGTALKAARYEWTRELCEADSDGDGWTNGEELVRRTCRCAAALEAEE